MKTGSASLAIAAFVAVTSVMPVGANERGLMTADEIREAVTANRVYLATPLGGELPMNYRPGGRVDASGEAIGLGRFFQPRDEGRWWINNNQLCQQWQQWYKGERMCFTLQRTGGNQLIWRRDNGESGRARLAPR